MTDVPVRPLPDASTEARPLSSGAAYDRVMVVCATWFLLGLFADGWSHYHDVRESFFTPYHGVLYSGYFANVAMVAYTLLRARRAGVGWRNAMPAGYAGTAVGVAWFAVGVVPDMLWHRIFGIEEGIDVLISPTHLFLGVGMALILLGPARAAVARRPMPATLDEQLPGVLSLALFLSMIEFTLQFAFDVGATASNAPLDPGTLRDAHLGFFLLPFTYYKEALGITIVIIHASLIAGFALYLAARLRPAFGSFMLLYGIPAFLMAALLASGALSVYIPTVEALVVGLVADGLLAKLRPEPRRTLAFRAFGVAVPVATYGVFFAGAQLAQGGVWWDVNLLFGSVLFAGVAGLLLAFLASPPDRATPAS